MKTYSVLSCSKLITLSLAISLCFVMAGCNVIWNVLNRNDLKRDIIELVYRCGVKISNPTCNMIDASRQGYCTFFATEKEIMALVSGLKLARVNLNFASEDLVRNTDESEYNSKYWYLEQTLHPFDFYKVNDRTKIKAFLISGRPSQLHLKSGRAFDYLLLYYDIISAQACIFVCYSYG